jgi:MBG domain/Right handed beta helix region
MKRKILIIAIVLVLSAALVMPIMVSANPTTINGENSGNTAIQDAINAASSGATISIAAGNYPEQLTINKPLTLIGAGATTVVASPLLTATTVSYTSGTKLYPIILVKGTTGVTIENLKIDGSVVGPTVDEPLFGIIFQNASGTISNTTVNNIALSQSLFGMQYGIAIFVQSDNIGGVSNVNIQNNVITAYDKAGIVCNENGTICTVTDNTVTGVDPTSLIAQNGIQIGYGAAATIANNHVNGNSYQGSGTGNTENYFTSTWQSCGILLYDALPATTISNNTVSSNDLGVCAYNETSSTTNIAINNNTISNNYSDGIVFDSVFGQSTGNSFQNNPVGLLVTDFASSGSVTSMNDTFNNNTTNSEALDGALQEGGTQEYSATLTFNVYNLQPSWTSVGGGGVWSSYQGPSNYDFISPGSTSLYDGLQAGPIYAGVNYDATDTVYEDQGLFAFKPGNTPISIFATQPFTYKFINQYGTLPVWVYIELNKGLPGDVMYQYVPPANPNPANYYTVSPAAGQWQAWTDLESGITTGSPLTLNQIATANPGAVVSRVYLAEGMGNSYHNGVTPSGIMANGTVAWVNNVVIGTTTYDFSVASISLGNLNQTYDGNQKSATATTNPVGLAVSFTYNGSNIPPVNAGSYSVVATINDPNYSGTASGTLVIGKATASLSLSNLYQTYDGNIKQITTQTNPSGLNVQILYNGLSTVPSGPGNYAIVATVNDPNSNPVTATGTLHIITPVAPPVWDINVDHVTNISDIASIGTMWLRTGTPGWCPQDINQDGKVNISDIAIVGQHWLQTWSLSSDISYYTVTDGNPFTRSLNPMNVISGNETVSQAIVNGSVNLNITNAPSYADCGFYLYTGLLKNLNSVTVDAASGSSDFGLNIWFDNDASGEFFNWNGNSYSGTGNDSYILGPSSQNGVLNVNAGSQFTSLQPNGGNYTLAQLKSGTAPGINGDTPIAIWIGITTGNGGNLNTTISSISIH